MKPGIRAVTFDAGNTLIKPWPSVGHVYAAVAAENGFPNLPPEELEQRFRQAFRTHGGTVNSRAEWMPIVDEVFAGLIAEPPSRSFFPELYERFARADAWRIYDDVLPTLAALTKHGIRLGVVSNWDERLRPLLGALELAAHFEVIVVSCEAGCAKPAPRIFEIAAQQLRLPPAGILHVGDSVEADVAGAHAAGFAAVRLDRSATASSDDSIRTLQCLLDRI